MNTASRAIHAILLLAFLFVPATTKAAEYLFYFDVSDSAIADRQAYLLELDRFVGQRLVSGDKAYLLLLNAETQHFKPFLTSEIPAPPGGISEKKKRDLIDSARSDLIVGAAEYLKSAPKANSTNILGAFVSAADHFRQEKVLPNSRCLVIFTDGLEVSRISGVNMEKQIPPKVPAKFVLPNDLQAEIHMIGIKPPNKSGAQETMRDFWQDAVSRSGSKLARYIRGL